MIDADVQRVRASIDSCDLTGAARLLVGIPDLQYDYDALLLSGEVQYLDGNLVEATNFFTLANRLRPIGYLSWYWLGIVRRDSGDRPGAAAAFVTALDYNSAHQRSSRALQSLSPSAVNPQPSNPHIDLSPPASPTSPPPPPAHSQESFSALTIPSDDDRRAYLEGRLKLEREVWKQDNWSVMPKAVRRGTAIFAVIVILGILGALAGVASVAIRMNNEGTGEEQWCLDVMETFPDSYPSICDKYKK